MLSQREQLCMGLGSVQAVAFQELSGPSGCFSFWQRTFSP